MAIGKRSSEIAKILHISKSTVDNHITSIGKNLNLTGRGKVVEEYNNRVRTAPTPIITGVRGYQLFCIVKQKTCSLVVKPTTITD